MRAEVFFSILGPVMAVVASSRKAPRAPGSVWHVSRVVQSFLGGGRHFWTGHTHRCLHALVIGKLFTIVNFWSTFPTQFTNIINTLIFSLWITETMDWKVQAYKKNKSLIEVG